MANKPITACFEYDLSFCTNERYEEFWLFGLDWIFGLVGFLDSWIGCTSVERNYRLFSCCCRNGLLSVKIIGFLDRCAVRALSLLDSPVAFRYGCAFRLTQMIGVMGFLDGLDFERLALLD